MMDGTANSPDLSGIDSIDDPSSIQSSPEFSNLRIDFSHAEATATNEHNIQVFLRIRPLKYEEEALDYSIRDGSIFSLSHPDSSTRRGRAGDTSEFSFDKVLDGASQLDVFQSTVQPLISDYLNGVNCLIFTYGVTSSGKTYTLQGHPNDSGVMPRAIDLIFKSIRVDSCVNPMPKFFNVFKEMGEEPVRAHNLNKARLLRSVKKSDESKLDDTTLLDFVRDHSAAKSEDDSLDAIDPSGDSFKHAVWLSCFEIYNESVADLLAPQTKKNERRAGLKMREDLNGNTYIVDLTEIKVDSAEEAYEIIAAAQRNRKVAGTALNAASSRSHCVYNLKLARLKPTGTVTSILSFCDLAGCERLSKTQATGTNMKEANNINNSIMILGQVMNQLKNRKPSSFVSFRSSKITKIFQNVLSGSGRAVMLVNVAPCRELFDETFNVLKHSAVAQKICTVARMASEVPHLQDSKTPRSSVRAPPSRNAAAALPTKTPSSRAVPATVEEETGASSAGESDDDRRRDDSCSSESEEGEDEYDQDPSTWKVPYPTYLELVDKLREVETGYEEERSRRQHLQSQLTELQDKYMQVQRTLGGCAEENSDRAHHAQMELFRLRSQMKEACRATVIGSDEKLKSAEATIADLREQLLDCQSKYTALIADFEDKSNQLDDALAKLEPGHVAAAAAASDSTLLRCERREEVDELQRRLFEADECKERLEADKEALQQQLADLQQQLDAAPPPQLNESHESVMENVELERENLQLSEENEQLKARVTQLQHELHLGASSLAQLQQTHATLVESNQVTLRDLSALRDQQQGQKQELAERDRRMDTLQRGVKELEEGRKKGEAEVKELREACAAKGELVSELRAKNSQLETVLQQQESKEAAAAGSSSLSSEAAEKLQQQVRDLSAQVRNREEHIASLQQELEATQKENVSPDGKSAAEVVKALNRSSLVNAGERKRGAGSLRKSGSALDEKVGNLTLEADKVSWTVNALLDAQPVSLRERLLAEKVSEAAERLQVERIRVKQLEYNPLAQSDLAAARNLAKDLQADLAIAEQRYQLSEERVNQLELRVGQLEQQVDHLQRQLHTHVSPPTASAAAIHEPSAGPDSPTISGGPNAESTRFSLDLLRSSPDDGEGDGGQLDESGPKTVHALRRRFEKRPSASEENSTSSTSGRGKRAAATRQPKQQKSPPKQRKTRAAAAKTRAKAPGLPKVPEGKAVGEQPQEDDSSGGGGGGVSGKVNSSTCTTDSLDQTTMSQLLLDDDSMVAPLTRSGRKAAAAADATSRLNTSKKRHLSSESDASMGAASGGSANKSRKIRPVKGQGALYKEAGAAAGSLNESTHDELGEMVSSVLPAATRSTRRKATGAARK